LDKEVPEGKSKPGWQRKTPKINLKNKIWAQDYLFNRKVVFSQRWRE
jgi:hypothetical protein